MPSQVTCHGCKQAMQPEQFLSACLAWDQNLDCIQFRCPHCAQTSEARLEPGHIWHGYIYAAGSAHFSAQLRELLPTLQIEQTPEGLKVTLDDATRTLPRS